MTYENKNPSWKVWVLWMLVYTITYILIKIGGPIRLFKLDAYVLRERWETNFLIFLGINILTSLIIGLVQWLILRPYGISPWWIIVTAIGISLSTFEEKGFIVWAVLQSLVLWRRLFDAGIWIIANSLVIFIDDNVSINVFNYLTKYNRLVTQPTFFMSILSQDTFLVRYITTGLLGGIITASVLVWLLSSQIPQSTSQSK